MGNVNAREEAISNTASAVEDDDAEICSSREAMAASDGTHPPPPELMGQSPPHSPRATQSPLMFAPQVSPLSLSQFQIRFFPLISDLNPKVCVFRFRSFHCKDLMKSTSQTPRGCNRLLPCMKRLATSKVSPR